MQMRETCPLSKVQQQRGAARWEVVLVLRWEIWRGAHNLSQPGRRSRLSVAVPDVCAQSGKAPPQLGG